MNLFVTSEYIYIDEKVTLNMLMIVVISSMLKVNADEE